MESANCWASAWWTLWWWNCHRAFRGAASTTLNVTTMVAGPAHASIHLGFSIEPDSVRFGGATPEILAGLYSLWDLLLGADEQWLYAPFSKVGLLSFDHSLWLDRGPGDWNADILSGLVHTPWPIEESGAPTTQQAFNGAAANLRKLMSQQILEVLRCVPVEWNVPIEDLEALGWFIYCRREAVAQRLEVLQYE